MQTCARNGLKAPGPKDLYRGGLRAQVHTRTKDWPMVGPKALLGDLGDSYNLFDESFKSRRIYMKFFALMLCLAPVMGWAAPVENNSDTKGVLQQAASGRIGLDTTYDNSRAAMKASSPVDGDLGTQKNAATPNLSLASLPVAEDNTAPPSPRQDKREMANQPAEHYTPVTEGRLGVSMFWGMVGAGIGLFTLGPIAAIVAGVVLCIAAFTGFKSPKDTIHEALKNGSGPYNNDLLFPPGTN